MSAIKGRNTMHGMMVRNRNSCTIYNRNNNVNFFELEDEQTKMIVSRKIVDDFSLDMQRFVDYMTRTIVEGILNDGR